MMPTISINGWKIDVEDGGSSYESAYVGESARAFSNKPKRLHQGKAKTANFTTVPLQSEDADTLEGLIEGRGHYWPFVDSLFSSSGIGPEPFSGTPNFTSLTTSVTAGVPPDGGALSGLTSIAYNVDAGNDYTLLYLIGGNLPTSVFLTYRSDGRYWSQQREIEAESAIQSNLFKASVSGRFLVLNLSGSTISHLAFLPFKASVNFIENFSRIAMPFSRFPFVHASGDFTDKKYVRATGSVTGQTYSKKISNGSTSNNLRSVQFSIEEADPLPPTGTLPYSPAFSVSFDSLTSVSGKRFPIAGSHVPWNTEIPNSSNLVSRAFNRGRQLSDESRLFSFLTSSSTPREAAPESVIKSLAGSESLSAIVISYASGVSANGYYYFDCRCSNLNYSALTFYHNSTQILFFASSDMNATESRSIFMNKPLSNDIGLLCAYGASANFRTGKMKMGYAYIDDIPGTDVVSSMATDVNTTFVSPSFNPISGRQFYLTQNYTTSTLNRFIGYFGTISIMRDTEITESMLRAAIRAFANGILK